MTEQLKPGHIASHHTYFPLERQLMILSEWVNHLEKIHLTKVMWRDVRPEVTQCLKNVGGREKKTVVFQITPASLHCAEQNVCYLYT